MSCQRPCPVRRLLWLAGTALTAIVAIATAAFSLGNADAEATLAIPQFVTAVSAEASAPMDRTGAAWRPVLAQR